MLVVVLLSGCSFVTSSRTPLFSADDFVAPVAPGRYVAADGTRLRLGVSGSRLLIRLTEPNGKISDMVGGAVPTRFPGYFVLQLTSVDAKARKVAYLPAHVGENAIWALFGPADDDPACNAVLIRHGFAWDGLGWSRSAPFNRDGLKAFYDDLLAVVAKDTRWATDGRAEPYKGMAFFKAASD